MYDLFQNLFLKKKKPFRKWLLIAGLTLLSLSLIHYIVFPQQTRSLFIGYSSFKKEGSLYYNSNTPAQNVALVQSLIKQASDRNQRFWGTLQAQPQIIYCLRGDDFKWYGSPYSVPAITHNKLGCRIVIGEEGTDIDIISHEMMHAELYTRIGFVKSNFSIPTWFDEGLAMQSDYRNYYSEDTLKALSNNYTQLPSLKTLETPTQFHTGNRSIIMLHYMTASHYVRQWYTREKLEKLIRDLKEGKDFETAFH